MPPTLICIRHAQGFHNLGPAFHGLPDPKLTPLGEEQCHLLRERSFADQTNISLIAASPLSRTLQTAFFVFGPRLEKSKILAIPDAQETSDFPCDTGSDVEALKDICREGGWPVDLELVEEGWNLKTVNSRFSPTSSAVKERAQDARRLLRGKLRELVLAGDKDARVVLVTHGGFLHYFTGDWEGFNKEQGTGWENCETRSYNFVRGVDSDEEDARLVETADSREKRGLSHAMFNQQKQDELFAERMRAFEEPAMETPGTTNTDGSGEDAVAKGVKESSTGHVDIVA